MSLLDRLSEPAAWDAYYAYKTEKRHLSRSEAAELHKFIEQQEYLAVTERIRTGGGFSVPEKKLIRKMGSDKKRTVYLFPREENTVLKLLTFLLLRQYDAEFPDNLYSFRSGAGVLKAMRRVLSMKELPRMYSYKTDIHDYFNSIPVEMLLPRLEALLRDEPEVYRLLAELLQDPRVLDQGVLTEEKKGVMAGTPFAVFLANLYLRETDEAAAREDFFYARYSDDILILAESEEARDRGAAFVAEQLEARGLTMNPKKVVRTSPGEAWSYLGIQYENGTVDISPVSRDKLRAKMRRKARAIRRWQVKKGLGEEQAARAFIKAMNRKFFDPSSSHELTWSRWYFPLINTDRTLKELDGYMQDWVRFLMSGRHRSANYRFRYEDMKKLGYQTLVGAWYKEKEAGS